MGGLVSLVYLAQSPDLSRIKSLTTLGTPFLGAASTFQLMVDGWEYHNLAGMSKTESRELIASFPSVYELLPIYPNCCLLADRKQFSVVESDLASLKKIVPSATSSDLAQMVENRKRLAKIVAEIDGGRFRSVPVYMIGASSHATAGRVTILENGAIKVESIRGDATVPTTSAGAGHAADLSPSQAQHQRIFDDDGAHSKILSILKNKTMDLALEAGGSYRIQPANAAAIEAELLMLRADKDTVNAGETVAITLTFSSKASQLPKKLIFGNFQFTENVAARNNLDSSWHFSFASSWLAPNKSGFSEITVPLAQGTAIEEIIYVVKD
jgi:pimeloyl-ACP methyl ester carboxylesterase